MTPAPSTQEQAVTPEQEVDIEAARERLTERVREAIDRQARGEEPERVLTQQDVRALRRLPFETMQDFVDEVVRDTMSAHEGAEAAEAKEPTGEGEITEPLMEDIAEHEKVIEDLDFVENTAEDVVKWYEEQKQEKGPAGDILDLESPDLAKEEKVRATEVGLEVMRNVFSGLDNYVVMASTALYLHGKSIEQTSGEERFIDSIPPGDLDVAVFDQGDFNAIMERLQRIEAHPSVDSVSIKRPEQIPGEDTKKMNGHIILNMEGKKYKYSLEFFLNTRGTHRLINPQTQKMSQKQEGIRVLNLEGLQRQYQTNLSIEKRIDAAVEPIREALTTDADVISVIHEGFEHWAENKTWPESGKFKDLVDHFQITPKDLAIAYGLNKDLREAEGSGNVAASTVIRSQLARVLGPFKTKVEKRRKNVREI